jgi:hypothetical protein
MQFPTMNALGYAEFLLALLYYNEGTIFRGADTVDAVPRYNSHVSTFKCKGAGTHPLTLA